MKGKWAPLAIFFLMSFIPLQVDGQAITEYGKQLEGLKERRPVVKQGPSISPGAGKKGSRSTGALGEAALPPGKPLPSLLLVNRSDVPLYATQDEQSATGIKLSQGENLIPLAKADGTVESWFMVKTNKGAVGWVRSSDVRERVKKR